MRWIINRLIMKILLIAILILLSIAYMYTEKRVIVNTVIALGEAIESGCIEEAEKMFLPDAVFVHADSEIPYRDALKKLDEKIKEGIFSGVMYVHEIEERNISRAIVSNVAWFKVYGVSYEASGVIELRKVGLCNWKVKNISSDMWAFGNVFFDMD